MPKIRRLKLTESEKAALIEMRDTHPRSYLRERAAALLKIAEGEVASQVAATGLLKRRDPDTVYSWLNRYEEGGLKGLEIEKGRGRKGSFSP